MENKNKNLWYNSDNFIVNAIIIIIALIIILSGAYANGSFSSFDLFQSIINQNSIYLLVLLYFVLIKFSFGKKYFNYLNLSLSVIYTIITVTSLLMMIQGFSLNTVLIFSLNFVLLIYIVHTLFRDTTVWKDYGLSASPFNELTNDWCFSAIVIVSLFLLSVILISTHVTSAIILSILDTVYFILLGRYLYLYRDYLDTNKIDSDNDGNFDFVRDKVQEVLDKTEIDEKLVEVKDKVVDYSSEIVDKIRDKTDDGFKVSKNKSIKNVDNKSNKKVKKGDNK